MARFMPISGARPINEGEQSLVQLLRDQLPETYTIIPNFELINAGQPAYEYDLVVIAPHALYVVEAKQWRGGIRGDDYNWYVGDGKRPRRNPWPTANNKARVLKSRVEATVRLHQIWVGAVVAIIDDDTRLELPGTWQNLVANYADVPAILRDASLLGGKAGDLRAIRPQIERAILQAAQGRRLGRLRFGDFVVDETLSQSEAVSEYLATNEALADDRVYRLRVFNYDPYLSSEEKLRRMEQIRRETKALNVIGDHPNLIRMHHFFNDPDDPNRFVSVTEWPPGETLRASIGQMEVDPYPLMQVIAIGRGIAAGLLAAHSAGVVHRDLRPENILLGKDGRVLLINFDHAKLSASGVRTVGPITLDTDVSAPYLAPELLDPRRAPTSGSDLYALGMILFELLVGQPLYQHPQDALTNATGAAGPVAFGANPETPKALDKLIAALIQPDPFIRIQDTHAVLQQLERVSTELQGQLIEEPATSAVAKEPTMFRVGDVIDDHYQVLAVLKSGGSGQLYQVYDPIADTALALKIYNDTSFSRQYIEREVRSLIAIGRVQHPHIVRVYNARQLRGSGRYYLLMEYVEGEDLTTYTDSTRDGNKRLSAPDAVQIILDLLSALEAIHPRQEQIDQLRALGRESELTAEAYDELQKLQEEGWIHRDIKPGNLMLGRDGVKLVDFNISVRVREAGRTWVGTPDYLLPGTGLRPWDAAADLFATGIVLFELVCGCHPYPDRQPGSADAPLDPSRFVPDLSAEFVQVLLRAVSADPADYFHTARQFREVLEGLHGIYYQPGSLANVISAETLELELWEIGKANYNPYVTRFLRLYSQARRDNSGTRGFDRVARMTYVPTRLDERLVMEALNGRYRLIIITGNAGDGKTAFIQNLEHRVRYENGPLESLSSNSSRFVYKGREFVTNYDGSQDEGEQRANDQVLTEFFEPFTDEQFVGVAHSTAVRLIAINQGRLLDFFNDARRFRQLGQMIHTFFDGADDSAGLPDWVKIVDLNQRSLVALDEAHENSSILERQLQALLKPDYWAPCEACALRERCFIKFNADTLADPVSGPIIRERIRTLFEIVHLRRQLHLTMRDVRSSMAWMLFRDHSCHDVARVLESSRAETRLRLLYYNAFASDDVPNGGTDDRLVQLLRQIDPAEVANPALDRALYFHRARALPLLSFKSRLADVEHPVSLGLADWDVELAGVDDGVLPAQSIARLLRRLAFFERRDEGWKKMLPYQRLPLFLEVTQRGQPNDTLKQTIAAGISLLEGAGRQQDSRWVFIRAGGRAKGPVKAFRLFQLSSFDIRVPLSRNGDDTEYTPDQIVFYYRPSSSGSGVSLIQMPELMVSLDLLELLSQVVAGYMPSTDDVQGVFLNLVMFKNSLMHLPYEFVRLHRDNGEIYELQQQNISQITLRPVRGGEANS